MRMGGQRRAPAVLPPRKTRYPLYRWLGGIQGRFERVRKISPPPGYNPRTVQPVANRYTDWATPAHAIILVELKIPDYLWGTLSLLFSGKRVLWSDIELQERDALYSPPYNGHIDCEKSMITQWQLYLIPIFYKNLSFLNQVKNNSNSEGDVIFVSLPTPQLQEPFGRLLAISILIFTASCFPLNHQTNCNLCDCF
jgi:hypothetical protein